MPGVVTAMEHLGGVATRAEIVKATSRLEFDRAVRDRVVRRTAHGRFALPTTAEARVAAHRLAGTATLLSAAAHWGWKTKWQPREPQVAVRRGRRLTEEQRRGVQVSWRAIPGTDVVDGWVTSRVRTVLDCAAALPFDEALAVADSALRSRQVTRRELRAAALRLPARGARSRVLRVVAAADAEAANPFESVLRAICLEMALGVVVQHRIERDDRLLARVDLAEVRLRIVLEADSYEFHGERELFDKDIVRYDELTVDGWLVLRFAWMHVMHRPAWVRTVIERAVAEREELLALRARVLELEAVVAPALQ